MCIHNYRKILYSVYPWGIWDIYILRSFIIETALAFEFRLTLIRGCVAVDTILSIRNRTKQWRARASR